MFDDVDICSKVRHEKSQANMQCSSTCGLPPSLCGALIALFFVTSMMICLQQLSSDTQLPQPLPLSARRSRPIFQHKRRNENNWKSEERRLHHKSDSQMSGEINKRKQSAEKNDKRKQNADQNVKNRQNTEKSDKRGQNADQNVNNRQNIEKSDKRGQTSDQSDKRKKSLGNVKSKKEITRRQEAVQKERIEHFRNQCKSYLLERNGDKNEGMKVLYSEKYSLAYRLVPKVGSTFMIQVYSILQNYGKTKNVFNLARNDIHDGRADNFRKTMPLKTLNDYTVLIMARNPYSRLYSAYIDKIFILNTFSLCKSVVSKLFGENGQKTNCKFDISFEQFLEYYLVKGGSAEEGHYGPIVSNNVGKKICNLKNILIIKQETFSDDIDHAFKSVNVKGREYDLIYDSLHSKNTETSISSIVKTVYNKFKSYINSGSCLSWKNIAKKLWVSFQIQGYIRDRSHFPEEKYDKADDYKNASYLIEVIMQEVNNKPLKHEEKIAQRNRALMKAYSGVSKKYIHEIQERYAMDFDLFHYGTRLKDAFD